MRLAREVHRLRVSLSESRRGYSDPERFFSEFKYWFPFLFLYWYSLRL